jgi:hypothetical protein
MLRSQKLAKARENTHTTDIAYMHVFNNPDGKKVLEDLAMRFVHEKLSSGDPHATVVRASQSDVITYIQRSIQNGVDGKSVR